MRNNGVVVGVVGGVVAVAVLFFVLASNTIVPPGWAGIVVNNVGTNRGVQNTPVRTGRIWYNPFTEDVYRFPTFQQNVVWAKDSASNTDQSITVNSSEGAVLNFDVSASVAFVEDSVPSIFKRFRKDEEHIMNFFIRPMVRKAFSDQASKMPAVNFFGAGKKAAQDTVLMTMRQNLAKYGIDVASVEIVGEIRVAKTVKASVDAVLTAAQKAIEAQNKIVQAEAEAQQRIAKARGDSLSAVIAASGEYEANRLLRQSITPEILEYKKLEKWNGVLPTVQGGGTPLINIKP